MKEDTERKLITETKSKKKKVVCEKAEDLYEKMLTLPLFPLMSEQDIKDVINAVKKVCNYYRK